MTQNTGTCETKDPRKPGSVRPNWKSLKLCTEKPPASVVPDLVENLGQQARRADVYIRNRRAM